MDKIIIEKHNKKLSNKVYPIISQRNEILNQTMPEQKKEENKSSFKDDKQKSYFEDVSVLEQESKVQQVYDFHAQPKFMSKNNKEDIMEVQSKSCINKNHDTLVQNININEINQKKIENSNMPQNFSTQGGSKIVSSNQNSGKQSQTDRNSIQLQDKFQQILQKRNEIQTEFLKQVSTKFQQTQFQFDQSIMTQRNQNNVSKQLNKSILDKSILDKSILEKSQIENQDKPIIDKSIFDKSLQEKSQKNEKQNERNKSNNKLRNSKFKGNYTLRMNDILQEQLKNNEKSNDKQQQYMSNNEGFDKLFQSHCNQEIKINNAKCYIDQIRLENNLFNQNFNSQQVSKTTKISEEQKKKDYQRMVYSEINNALTNNLNELTIQLMNKYQQNINSKFNQNWGIIHFACKFANQQLLDYVKEQKGDINLLNSKQQTGLFICIKNSQLEFLKQMLLLDISINYQDYNGNTILHYAVKQNKIEIIKFLLTNKKINLNIENITGKKAIDLTENTQIKQIFEISLKPKMILKQLGQQGKAFILNIGSYGEVFLVELIENKQKFAMKTLEKKKVLEQNLVEYIYAEKNILQTLNHPFIVKLRYSFQNHSYLFMILDLCNKGDLEQLIKKKKILTEDQARFYMAEVLLGMEYIHSQNIIYRDLKPENVVIDQTGHAKITDFGLAKENITHNTKSFCGTYAYLAPEMINKKGHTKTLDWYIFGTVLYEFLTGLIPFYNNNRDKMFQNVLTQKLNIPNNISPEAQSIIAQLTEKNPDKRLGRKGAYEIKDHPFFKSIDWDKLYNKEIEPPVLNQQIEIKQNSGSNLTQQIKYQSYKIKQWSFYQQ